MRAKLYVTRILHPDTDGLYTQAREDGSKVIEVFLLMIRNEKVHPDVLSVINLATKIVGKLEFKNYREVVAVSAVLSREISILSVP